MTKQRSQRKKFLSIPIEHNPLNLFSENVIMIENKSPSYFFRTMFPEFYVDTRKDRIETPEERHIKVVFPTPKDPIKIVYDTVDVTSLDFLSEKVSSDILHCDGFDELLEEIDLYRQA